jgi:hypothetical protein
VTGAGGRGGTTCFLQLFKKQSDKQGKKIKTEFILIKEIAQLMHYLFK